MTEYALEALADLVDPKRRITYGVVKPGPHDPDGVVFVRGGDIAAGRIDIDNLRTITRDVSDSYKRTLLQGGELLVSLVGKPGEVAIAPERLAGANIARQVGLVALRKDICARYVMYFLMSRQGRALLSSRSKGSVQTVINLADLKAARVPLPPISTQWRIAGILSAYDDLIENNTKRIKILEEMARVLYREWFVHFRFPGHEKVKLVDYPLGQIPEGWDVGRLDDALVLQRGFDLPKKARIPGRVPIYASTGVVGSHNEAKMKGPAVVTGRSGSLGTVRFVEGEYWPLNTALWSRGLKRVSAHYAYFLLQELDLARMGGGAAVPTLNRNHVHAMEIVLPPAAAVTDFDELVVPMFKLRSVLRNQNEALTEARDLLLPRLISGEIDVDALELPEAAQ